MATAELSVEEIIEFCEYAQAGGIATENHQIFKHGYCFGVLTTAVTGHLSERGCLDHGLNFGKVTADVFAEYHEMRSRGEYWHSGPYKFIVHVMQTKLPKRENGCPNTDYWLSDIKRHRLGIQ